MLEQILSHHLDPSVAVDPLQLGSLFEMNLCLAYDKKVKREFYADVLDISFRGVALLEALKSEVRLLHALDMPDAVRKTLKSALDLSTKEIKGIRIKAFEQFKLMRQIPPPGTMLS